MKSTLPFLQYQVPLEFFAIPLYEKSTLDDIIERAKEYLAEYAKTNFSYNVGLHDKFLKQNQSVYNELIEGSKLSVYDEELGISEEEFNMEVSKLLA